MRAGPFHPFVLSVWKRKETTGGRKVNNVQAKGHSPGHSGPDLPGPIHHDGNQLLLLVDKSSHMIAPAMLRLPAFATSANEYYMLLVDMSSFS